MSGSTLLIAIGLLLAAAGVLAHFGLFAWFGHLPGDIRIERGNTRVFIPITSMVVVSAAISVIANVIRRLIG